MRITAGIFAVAFTAHTPSGSAMVSIYESCAFPGNWTATCVAESTIVAKGTSTTTTATSIITGVAEFDRNAYVLSLISSTCLANGCCSVGFNLTAGAYKLTTMGPCHASATAIPLLNFGTVQVPALMSVITTALDIAMLILM
jgi:hypothetical protein